MDAVVLREKSSQSSRIHFGALRDEKNRRFVSFPGKEIK
jgi:hypothetical protein